MATINSSTGAVAGVSAGTAVMTYTVSGTGGCANASTTATVTVSTAPNSGTISGNTSICSAGSTTLTTTATGGTWSSATPSVATINASTGAVTGVSGGTSLMTYTVTGTGGCANATSNVLVVVTATPATPIVSVTQPTCAITTGSINFTNVVGVQYSVNGSNYQVSSAFSYLQPGVYPIAIRSTSNTSCVATGTSVTIVASLGAPSLPTATITVQPTCAIPTGTIVVSSPLGAFDYSLNGTSYQSSTNFAGLAPGTYNLTARRTADQTCESAVVSFTIYPVPTTPVAPSAIATQPTCAVPTGTINFNAQTAVQYSINGTSYQSSGIFSNLTPGSYTLSVRNANDATCITTGSVITINASAGAPAAPTASATTQPTCAAPTGVITITAPIGAFTYSIDGVNYQAATTYSGLNPGTYNISTRRTNDITCISTATTVTINTVPALPSIPTAAVTQPTCAVQTGSINFVSQTAVQYALNNGAYQANTLFSGLAPGTYFLYARNVNDGSCISIGSPVVVNAIPSAPATPVVANVVQPICGTNTGSFTVSNPLGNFTYSINGTSYQANNSFSGLLPGTYNCTVRSTTDLTCVSAATAVTINAVPNCLPVANNDQSSTNEDTPVSFNITNNDTDVDGTINFNSVDLDPSTPGIQTTVTNPQGTWTVTGGVVTFTPVANFNGAASINYTVNDNSGATTNVATVTVTVLPVNDAPVANNDSATTNEDSPVSFNITNNDTDLDGTIDVTTVDLDPTTPGIQTTFTNAQGTWTVTGGVVTFTPAANFNGSATINYSVNDNGGATTNVATITVTVLPVNDAPVANNDSATTNEDSPVSFNITNNDTDLDGTIDVNTVDLNPSTPGIQTTFTNAQGTWTVTGGVVTFTPASNFNGSATINYTVNDNGGATTNVATITVTVVPVNDAPVANNDSASTNEDSPVSFNITNNDTDLDGTIDVTTVDLDPTTPGIQTTFTNAQGTWTVTGGVVTFTPAANFNGSATINYTVNDNGGATTNVATITVTILPVNDAPIANNDSATTNEDTPVSFNITNNDTDLDGTIDVNTVDLNPTTPGIQTTFTNAQGTWTVNGGVVTFTPVANFNGSASINYTVNDNSGATTNVATITVTVVPVNDAPVANNDNASTNEDAPVSFNITSNDTDIDGTINTNSVDLNPSTPGIQTTFTNAQGTWTVTGGVVTFTPAANFNGVASINYTVNDNGGATSNVATITVNVVPVNDAPVLDNEYISVNYNGIQTGDLTNTGDFDPDGTTLVVNTTPLVAPQNGVITIAQDGTFSYQPNANYVGTDLVVVQICDQGSPLPYLCATDTIYITVNPCSAQDVNQDCDFDGLTNGEETALGSDPFDPDTDGDGVLDGTEVADGTNPLNPCSFVFASQTVTPSTAWNNLDCDNDGLTNGQEILAGTDPTNPDTDGDGVLDGTEVADGTNPNDPCSFVFASQTVTPSAAWNNLDCDNDGLTNGQEVTLGTDPTNPDTDGDGVLDGTEVADGTNPTDPCSFVFASQTVAPSTTWNNLDCDNDGLPNGQEILAGTDPTNPDTDGDGVLDGTEVADGTNPTDPCSLVFANQTVAPSVAWNGLDCDNDGLLNGEEITIGTDPTDPDTDGDGVIDGMEVHDQTNPIDPCQYIFANQTVSPSAEWAAIDCDGDGLTNGEELTNGNDPTDPCDPLVQGSDCNVNISIPEAFSPDGDGTNDTFVIEGIEYFDENEIIIFNRWGSEVFRMSPYNNSWNGNSQSALNVGGDELPTGTYFYILDTKTDKYGVIKGYIYLKR
ncbi:MAG: hypothetical protein RLZZ211_1982 [Bacteroidota bacterium]